MAWKVQTDSNFQVGYLEESGVNVSQEKSSY